MFMLPKSFIRNETIANKIFWLVLKTTVPAVLIVSATLIWQHVHYIRKSKVDEILAIVDVLAHQSTAVVSFQRDEEATDLLESLQNRDQVIHAVIIDMDGNVFAKYSRDEEHPFEFPKDLSPGYVFNHEGLEIRYPIVEFEQQIATLVMAVDATDISQSVREFVGSSIAVIVAVLSIGLALASRLQRTISGPIMDLAHTAREISHQADYSLRVDNSYAGEIGELCDHFNEMLEQVENANDSLNEAHCELVAKSEDLEKRVQDRTRQLASANEKLLTEISDKEKANKELKDVQDQLMDSSRQAGMAEIANGVLHNVGNVLNSVNVSATMISGKINGLKVESLQKTNDLIREHENDLAAFFANDKRAKQIPSFIDKLIEHFQATQVEAAKEVESLHKNVEFIKDVIQSQQSFAGGSGLMSTVNSAEIFDDALRFIGGSFSRHSIKIEKEYEATPDLQVDKSKLLQILTNFIKNAREAMNETPEEKKCVTLAIRIAPENMLEFSVKDTGYGISAANLGRIYTHGFTTKKNGHGFGLHSAALAAKEMGGSVTVKSDGVGRGATFSVQVPLENAAATQPIVDMPRVSTGDTQLNM